MPVQVFLRVREGWALRAWEPVEAHRHVAGSVGRSNLWHLMPAVRQRAETQLDDFGIEACILPSMLHFASLERTRCKRYAAVAAVRLSHGKDSRLVEAKILAFHECVAGHAEKGTARVTHHSCPWTRGRCWGRSRGQSKYRRCLRWSWCWCRRRRHSWRPPLHLHPLPGWQIPVRPEIQPTRGRRSRQTKHGPWSWRCSPSARSRCWPGGWTWPPWSR